MSGISEDEVSEDNMKFDKPVPAQSSKGNHSLPIALYQLNGQNFLWWSQSVMHFIRRKGKVGYLTGFYTAPSKDDLTFPLWDLENSMIMTSIWD